MEYATSPVVLWNLCQQSLLRHGELHNNLRMTWGKAVPLWTESLEHSLYIGQVLNDKYALDGRDPSSVVGIQWCHGLFDRPFFPSMPVMGVVRKRDVLTHASRLDVEAYATHINRNQGHNEGLHYAVGTGIVGSFIARVLHEHGLKVQILASKDGASLHQHEERIEALDAGSFPPWMEQRVASMCEDPDVNSVADVARQMRKGIAQVRSLLGAEAGLVVNENQPESSEGEHLATLIDRAVWQAVEVIWGVNAAEKPTKTSIQTQLF